MNEEVINILGPAYGDRAARKSSAARLSHRRVRYYYACRVRYYANWLRLRKKTKRGKRALLEAFVDKEGNPARWPEIEQITPDSESMEAAIALKVADVRVPGVLAKLTNKIVTNLMPMVSIAERRDRGITQPLYAWNEIAAAYRNWVPRKRLPKGTTNIMQRVFEDQLNVRAMRNVLSRHGEVTDRKNLNEAIISYLNRWVDFVTLWNNDFSLEEPRLYSTDRLGVGRLGVGRQCWLSAVTRLGTKTVLVPTQAGPVPRPILARWPIHPQYDGPLHHIAFLSTTPQQVMHSYAIHEPEKVSTKRLRVASTREAAALIAEWESANPEHTVADYLLPLGLK